MLVFLHIESASDCEPTFPIEVYVSSGDGGSAGWLVNPASIERWKHLPAAFVSEHHISASDLASIGTPAAEVCLQLMTRTSGVTTYSLAPDRHRVLLNELFSAAIQEQNPVRVEDARPALVSILRAPGSSGAANAESLLLEAFEIARRSRPPVRGGAFEIPFLHAVEAACHALAGA